jgi:nitrite reductase/ring-hydroxylating ferredoxin subunit
MAESPERRVFLTQVAAVGAACACGTLAGCSTDESFLEADVVLALADYPDLAEVGGQIRVPKSVSNFDYGIFVRNEGEGVYRALSAWCPHAGCSVETRGSGFRCPCHGARFNAEGDRTGGPAPRGLTVFDTTSDETTVTILANG